MRNRQSNVDQKKRRFFITPINPFTPRQAEVVELRASGLKYDEISKRLGISPHTVKTLLLGINGLKDRSSLGAFGVVESITGVRPNKCNSFSTLIGDVLFDTEDWQKSKRRITKE